MILTEEQIQIRDVARDFARKRLALFAAEWDRAHAFPVDALQEMGALGFLACCCPRPTVDTGQVAYTLALEEIAAGDGACSRRNR